MTRLVLITAAVFFLVQLSVRSLEEEQAHTPLCAHEPNIAPDLIVASKRLKILQQGHSFCDGPPVLH